MEGKRITVITPTTGKLKGLEDIIDSISAQENSDEIYHLILWDDYREKGAKDPEYYNKPGERYSIYIPGNLGNNCAQNLRPMGLMAAQTPWVTLKDDDIWMDDDFYSIVRENIMDAGYDWGAVRRKVYHPETGELIGKDRFESVGDSNEDISPNRVDYEMLDGNVTVFKREYGVYAAPLYREVPKGFYGDDRLMYNYLKENSDNYKLLTDYVINQTCPDKLIDMFVNNCD